MNVFMVQFLQLLLLLISLSSVSAEGGSTAGNPDLYAYFETPLKDDVGAIGPSKWRDLDHIPNNQCGGNGQVNGFGQSPLVLPEELFYFNICHDGMDGYVPTPATCSWSDVEFKVTTHGLILKVKEDDHHDDHHDDHDHHDAEPCHLGMIEIPQSDKKYKASEIKIKLGSEHVIDGYSTSYELQILHKEDSGETQSMLSFFVEVADLDWSSENPDFDEGEYMSG